MGGTGPVFKMIDGFMTRIQGERHRQVRLGYTAEHDAKHTKDEWRAIIALQTLKVSNVLANDDASDFQLDNELVKLAAVTLAWGEARGIGNNNNTD